MTNSPSTLTQKKIISVDIAILIGQLFVNLPVFIITIVAFGLGVASAFLLRVIFLPSLPTFALLLVGMLFILPGALVGWMWWSFSVPRWRKWALQNGAPEDELQKWAVITGLVWPKGWIFEKTEFKVRE